MQHLFKELSHTCVGERSCKLCLLVLNTEETAHALNMFAVLFGISLILYNIILCMYAYTLWVVLYELLNYWRSG